jgi:formate hydrogenlyase subunit 3/multisubunit Na+/H+ antiporter MnhD subunit
MKELYLISTLGTVKAIAIVLFIIAIVIFIGMLIWRMDMQPFNPNYNPHVYCDKVSKRGIKISLIVALFNMCIMIFIPTRYELYTIYGIGTVIDYIQENPEAQQLPDKTIKYLNTIADKYIEDNKE